MKRRLIAVLLTAVLLAGVVFVAVAASDFVDIDNHWAKSYINDAVSRGLFVGTDSRHFSPDMKLTRAMFVTVLCRTVGADAETADLDISFLKSYFTDVDLNQWYAPYVAWAVRNGITSGVGNNKFAPNDPVTREQMACFIDRYLNPTKKTVPEAVADSIPALPDGMGRPEFTPTHRETRGGDVILPPDEFDDDEYFSDAKKISSWAKASVDRLQDSGLFSGSPDGKGGYKFRPADYATRAEGAVVFCKLQDLLKKRTAVEQIAVQNIVINQDSAEVEEDATLTLSATVFPLDATNSTVVWYSTDTSILTVDENGCVTGVAEGEAEVHAMASNGAEATCAFTVTEKPEVEVVFNTDLYAPTGWYDKCLLVFDKYLSDPRLAYADAAEAKQHMTTVRVPAWDIDADGEKFTRFFYLEVNEAVVDIVTEIFNEIYALPEQVPIHSLGGYRWDGKCEHSVGLAIDINPLENYYCKTDGTAVVGQYFKPDEDPYSIPVMGAVDQIFAKYGFTRGIYWNCGYKDYMHYSYFGT